MICGQAQAVEQAWVGEAPADDLVAPAAGEHVLGLAPHSLGVGEPAGRAAAGGQRGGQPPEPVDAGDLLDQVDLAADIVAALGGHAHLQLAATAADGEVERGEDLALALGRDLDAED